MANYILKTLKVAKKIIEANTCRGTMTEPILKELKRRELDGTLEKEKINKIVDVLKLQVKVNLIETECENAEEAVDRLIQLTN